MHMILNEILVITLSCLPFTANDPLQSRVLSENDVTIMNALMKSGESIILFLLLTAYNRNQGV